MNKLSFISSIPSDNDTTIYLVPTNSQKSLQFFNVELNMHFYDLSGNSRLTIPVNANDDGVYFKLSQLSSLGLGTYAFYLSMRYSDHMEYYPSNTAKYITLAYNNNRLVFKSIFTPEATNITPPDTSKIVERQVLHVHDIDIKDIKVSTIDSNKNANVYLDQYDVLHFDIPKGETGKSLYELARDAGFTGSFKDYEKTLVGPTGPKGDRGYNIWFDTHDYGENYRGSYWTDLKGSAPDRGPQVSDLVVLSSGHLVQVTGVSYGGVPEAGGGTFNYGPYLANLAGVAGPRGERGATGLQGPQGIQGNTGATGPQGPIGPIGPKGETGPAGKDGADGKASYFHVAYANSADGNDGFYVGGGTNLLTGTAKCDKLTWGNNGGTQTIEKYDDETNYIQHISKTPINRMGPWRSMTPEVGQVYTLSADVCGNGYLQGDSFCYEGGDEGSLGRVDLTNDWQRISNTFRVNMIAGNWVIYANNSTLLKVKHIKIEKGSVATPWSPAPSEAHPSYMGTYTNYTQTASLDPTAYQWSQIKGDRGLSIWFNKNAYGGNLQGKWWSDLYNTRVGFGPQVGDLVIQPNGMITQVTAVNASGDASTGGGTFDIGAVIGNMQGPIGRTGENGRDGLSAYQLAINNGFKGTEKEWLDSLKVSNESSARHAPTGWTLDRTTNPWTIWFDNGCGLQIPDYGTLATVYGYGFPVNIQNTSLDVWPLVGGIMSASHGTLTLGAISKITGGADYWGPNTKVINPIRTDAGDYDWSNVYFNDGSRDRKGQYQSDRQKVMLRVMYELGIFSAEDLKTFGLVKK